MSENTGIKTTEWAFDERFPEGYFCKKCTKTEGNKGHMVKRRVVGRDGEEHKEYKIVCYGCGRKSGVHRNPDLTIIDWRSLQQPDEIPLKHRNRTENTSL